MRQMWQADIRGKLCDGCTEDLKSDLRTFEAAEEFREAIEENEERTFIPVERNKGLKLEKLISTSAHSIAALKLERGLLFSK